MSYMTMKEESQKVLEACEKFELEQRARKKAQMASKRKNEQVCVAMTGELYSKLMLYAGRRKKPISAAARELIENGLKEE